MKPSPSATSPDPIPRKFDWIIDTIMPSLSAVVKYVVSPWLGACPDHVIVNRIQSDQLRALLRVLL
jgi:hypothetical protein